MTTKNPKTRWWWQWLCLIDSCISVWCPVKWLHLSEYQSKAELNYHSLACGRCRLLSDWYSIGCQNNTKYPQYQYYPIPVNIAQYPITQYQYRCSNPNYHYNYQYHQRAFFPMTFTATSVVHVQRQMSFLDTQIILFTYCLHTNLLTYLTYWIGLDWTEQSLMAHPTQYRSFRGRLLQPITWLLLTNKQ